MKLLVVNPWAVTPERQEFYLRLQATTGWQVTLLTARQWTNDYGRRVEVQRLSGYRGGLIDFPVMLRGNIPLHAYRARLKPVLRRERPDVIFVHHEPYALSTFQIFRANGGHAAIGFYSAQNINKKYPWPFRAMERFVLDNADFATPVSDRVAGVLNRKRYSGPSHVIPLGVDMELFRPAPAYEISTNGKVLRVGFSGRLVPEKGVEILLEAISALPPNRFTTVIIGDGPMSNRLRRQAIELGLEARVVWRGYVPNQELPSLYRELDVLVVPSRTTLRWKEQFGRVVIEAQSCRVGVITSDSGELPHLIAATAGWTFTEGNSQGLARVLAHVDRNRHELASVQGRALAAIRRHFDIDVVVGLFAEAVEAAHLRHRRD
jgi:glycosyltransferase involved in cell wall biosynthesis